MKMLVVGEVLCTYCVCCIGIPLARLFLLLRSALMGVVLFVERGG